MSGVTSRTLRHYDAMGLLPPAGTASSGHRYYEEGGLLRLQQILLLRELGLGLRQIADILDQQTDRISVLREHRQRLLAERDRLDTLVHTVGRTIAELEDGRESSGMAKIDKPENLFDGFDVSRLEAEAQERWPREAEQTKQFIDTLSDEDIERMRRETTEQMVRMAEFMTAGTPGTDSAVQAEVDTHYRRVSQAWTPTAAAFRTLGQTYVDDPSWQSAFETVAPGLATYQRDAMNVYADTELT